MPKFTDKFLVLLSAKFVPRSKALLKPSMPDIPRFEERLGEAVLRQLRSDIGRFNQNTDPKDISAVIDRIVAADLNEITVDRLIKTVKRQTGSTMSTLRKQLAQAFRRSHNRDDEKIAELIPSSTNNTSS